MKGDDLTARLRATFVQELEEQVRALNAGLLALEQRPGDRETIRSLFRSAHTIKGAARVAAVPGVEQLCHALESIFADVRDGARTLSGADFSLLFAASDALDDVGGRLRVNELPGDSAARALLPLLQSLARSDSPAPPRAGGAAAESVPDAAAGPVPDTDAARVPDAEVDSVRDTESDPVPETGIPAPIQGERGELIRVRTDRLDGLLSAVGEMIVATGRIVERVGRRDTDARRLDRAADGVAELVHQLRLRPFGEVCEGLPRAVRDLAAATGKEVELVIRGADVEADRLVMDVLREPLVHLVRNAVDHGIESPAERERRGKPRAGRIEAAAELAAGRLVVTVSDDGGGLDEAAIRARLQERGQPVPGSSAELAEALLLGGFSTRARPTAISGRGVGLDIVRAALARIGGAADVAWTVGTGTTFRLECPPTPATLRAVLVRLGTHLFALPSASVERLKRVEVDSLRTAGGRTMLATRGDPVPVLSLARLLGPPLDDRPIAQTVTVVLVVAGARRAAFIVDEVLDEDDVVVRPLPGARGAVPHTAGAAVLPSGRIALVLTAASLLAAGLRSGAGGLTVRAQADAQRRRILVADDSITTRTLEQSMLEAAGYEVLTAVDGEDAWDRLERERVDALVADVEMPRMDGFALCRRVRSSMRLAELPVVLVTGLSSEADRARGLEAGADAYIVKSSFDQATLLDAVNQLIGDG